MIQNEFSLFIYLPCHTDYELAVEKAHQLHMQSKQSKMNIKILVGINGVLGDFNSIIKLLPENVSLRVINENLDPDTNICLGFIECLEVRPDFFWIVSANEKLTDNCINFVEHMIFENQDADLFVASLDRDRDIEVRNIILRMPKKSSLGLITSTIYKYKSFSKNFKVAMNYSWTGWGHLSVIQSAILQNRILIHEFPDHLLYEKPKVFIPKEKSIYSEREFIRSNYKHSFFGLPLLFMILFYKDRRYAKREIAKWVFLNWRYLNYFGKVRDLNGRLLDNRNAYLFLLELRALSPFLYLIAKVGFLVNIYNVKKYLSNK